mmetsp:Transcript_16033/g.50413  ORF Transcript_16033/g.50413 Transcript_16033/m.50413 type:complete len:340 (-) Transcript_16033:362-1381(-)
MMLHTFPLKSAIVHSRSVCSLPPCRERHGYPALRRFRNTESQRSWLCVNTRTLPSSYHSPRSSSRRYSRSSSSSVRTSMICVMSALTMLRPPTWISTGLSRAARASDSTCRGKVAENMTVWRSGRHRPTIREICGSNPMSNIRSASSITRYVTLRKLVIFPAPVARMSIMRPGVHTTISAPLLSAPIWSATPEPPNTVQIRSASWRANALASFPICWTSSRVGAMTRQIGPSPIASGGWSLMCRSMGMRNAIVLPEPVFAMPMQSRPLMMTGRACAWIGIGLSYPFFRMTSRMRWLRPHCVHPLMGAGTSLPRTLMLSRAFRRAAMSSGDMRWISAAAM